MTSTRFTSRDLEALPDKPGWRYEIIDGELLVTKAAGWEHDVVLGLVLLRWSVGMRKLPPAGWALALAWSLPTTT